MTKEELHALAWDVYRTDKWASSMASDLTAAGRQTAPATVNHWQSGERPPATWLDAALIGAWVNRARRLREMADRAMEAASRLSATLAPEPNLDNEPTPEPRM